MRTEEDRAAVADKECGNGVRIDHGEGWHTQYCHMRRGSIAVKEGDKIDVGVKLGEVGYSGNATFPHVHLSVSMDMQPVDPFLPAKDAQCGAPSRMLWTDAAKAKLAYQSGTLLGSASPMVR